MPQVKIYFWLKTYMLLTLEVLIKDSHIIKIIDIMFIKNYLWS